VKLRPFEPRDIADVLAIQSRCPELAQWTRHDYDLVGNEVMRGWIAEEGGEITGFIIARHISGEMEILNLAVRPEDRRRRHGKALLETALDWGRAAGAARVFLEVRASNLAALSFYEKHGFEGAGRRTNYYTAPVEDALILAASFAPSGRGPGTGA